jgi:hypothetical protein
MKNAFVKVNNTIVNITEIAYVEYHENVRSISIHFKTTDWSLTTGNVTRTMFEELFRRMCEQEREQN